MKCSNCGAELAEGAKFCGECGAKVVKDSVCPKCGAACATGAKFCCECGSSLSVCDEKAGKTPTPEAVAETKPDWESPVKTEDSSLYLDQEQVESVRFDLERVRREMKDETRLVLADEPAFEAKLRNICKVLTDRLGEWPDGSWYEVLKATSIGFIDNGKSGLGQRGTLFTATAIIPIDNVYPKIYDGSPAGFVPWKFFYKLARPENETSYCLMDMKDLLTSSAVSEDLRARLAHETGEDAEMANTRFLFRFGAEGVGLSARRVNNFMENLKGSIGDYDVFDEDDLEEDDEDADEMLDEEEE